MPLIAYQALLANPQNIAQVKARIRDVERAGGRVELAPPSPAGLVLVLLSLPAGIAPAQVFPGIPFFPV